MPRKSSGARQSSMSPDLMPMRSRGLSLGKALGYSPWSAGWTNQMLPSAWARSAAWRSASLVLAGWQFALLKAGAALSFALMALMAREAWAFAMFTTWGA